MEFLLQRVRMKRDPKFPSRTVTPRVSSWNTVIRGSRSVLRGRAIHSACQILSGHRQYMVEQIVLETLENRGFRRSEVVAAAGLWPDEVRRLERGYSDRKYCARNVY